MLYDYDVIIVGGGVSGTALYYVLAKYTALQKVALFERRNKLGLVASHYTQNSQTLHFGDIETNYKFEKAKSVSRGARYVQNYLDTFDTDKLIHSVFPKMVLAVGSDEVKQLRERFNTFKVLFPKLQLIDKEEIAKQEPMILKGRDPNEELAAMATPDGYTVDYSRLAESFVEQTTKLKTKKDFTLSLHTQIQKIEPIDGGKKGYIVHTPKGARSTKAIIVDAGAMSIKIAQDLGYGKHLSIFSVAGNFYRGPQVLNGKVYTLQNDKLPFAAVHGDPDVRATGYTRFGPSAKVILALERRNKKTIRDYFRIFKFNWDGFMSVKKIMFDKVYFNYMFQNYLYELPFIGTRIFAKNAQKIVPSIKKSQIKRDKGYGGTRPQIIDTKKRTIATGEARIEGERAIFNITPSPGASTCLANAKRDAKELEKWLGKEVAFDEKQMDNDLLKV